MTPSAAVSEDRLRVKDFFHLPIGEDHEIVCTPGRRSTLPASIVLALLRCRNFKPAGTHAEHYVRSLDGEARQRLHADIIAFCRERSLLFEPERHALDRNLARTFSRLAEEGLLFSLDSVLNDCRSAILPPDPPPISALTVVGRSGEALAASLSTYIANTRGRGRKDDYIAIDLNEDARERQNTRQRLSELKARYGVEVRYCGLEERTRFVEALRSDAARFALLGSAQLGAGLGAARNVFLLETAGSLAFCADEGTFCEPRRSASFAPGLSLVSGFSPRETWFFEDAESALQSAKVEDWDILALHETFLGKSAARCVVQSAAASDTRFDGAGAGLLGRLGHGGGRVVATFNGILGRHPGTLEDLLLQEWNSLRRLIDTEDTYRNALGQRQVSWSAGVASIVERSLGNLRFHGLDHRSILPPFSPVLGGEEASWAASLGRVVDGALSTELPWTMRCVSNQAVDDGDEQTCWKDMLSDAVSSCDFGLSRLSDAQRLKTLGRHLKSLGELEDPQFERVFRNLAWNKARGRLQDLEKALSNYSDLPRYWTNEMKARIHGFRTRMARIDFAVPRDLSAGAEREALARHGTLLEAWPDICDAALNLRRKGLKIAQPV